MGDCLVHWPTLEQHLLDVAEVLEILRRRQLYAKGSKCEFGRQELGFLGHRLSKEGVSVDPRKVQSIVEWATPTSCSEVRRFTGLANYYRRFVEGYSEVAAPLTALGSPSTRFAWTPAAQASFDALKLALSSAPVLRTFDPARRAVLTMDGSNVAVAAILAQPDDEGHQHPVAYGSRKLTAAEQNYPAQVFELLAGGSRAARVPSLSAGRRGTSAGWLLDRLRPSDGQPEDHVAQEKQASEQDVRSLARRDGGLPLRRDAPAGLAKSDGPAVAPRLRRRCRPCYADGRRRSGKPAGALLAAGPRHPSASAARHCPRQVGGQPARGGGDVRLPEGCTPSHTAQGGALSPPCTNMFIALTVAELSLLARLLPCCHRSPPTTSSSRRRSSRP
jgi:hypothetical protein